jgi:tetratricopeptide (TPR) repeat protein
MKDRMPNATDSNKSSSVELADDSLPLAQTCTAGLHGGGGSTVMGISPAETGSEAHAISRDSVTSLSVFIGSPDEVNASDNRPQILHILHHEQEAWGEFGRLIAADRASDARRLAQSVLTHTTEHFRWIHGCALAEMQAGFIRQAYSLFLAAAALSCTSSDDELKGKFFNNYAMACRRVGELENSEELRDRALLHYQAAEFYFERSGSEDHLAKTLNNSAYILSQAGKHADAHEYLDRAVTVFRRRGLRTREAEADDTRARVLLAEHRLDEAHTCVHRAVSALRGSGEVRALNDALNTERRVVDAMQNEVG